MAADIPGIIEGAHAGAGLGLQFLRHVERTRALLHVVDASGTSGRDPVEDLRLVREEVRRWQPELLERPQLTLQVPAGDHRHRAGVVHVVSAAEAAQIAAGHHDRHQDRDANDGQPLGTTEEAEPVLRPRRQEGVIAGHFLEDQ